MRDSTETVHIKATLFRILAHDIADLKDSLLVLVHLSMAHLPMQRLLIGNLQVAKREIDSDCNLHLPSLGEVVEQTGPHVHLKFVENQRSRYFSLLVPDVEWFVYIQHLDTPSRRVNVTVHPVLAVVSVVVDCEAQR